MAEARRAAARGDSAAARAHLEQARLVRASTTPRLGGLARFPPQAPQAEPALFGQSRRFVLARLQILLIRVRQVVSAYGSLLL